MVSHYLQNLVQAPNKADEAFHNLFLVFLSLVTSPIPSWTLWLTNANHSIFLWQTWRRICGGGYRRPYGGFIPWRWIPPTYGCFIPVLRTVSQFNSYTYIWKWKLKMKVRKTLCISDSLYSFLSWQKKKLHRCKLGMNNNTKDIL